MSTEMLKYREYNKKSFLSISNRMVYGFFKASIDVNFLSTFCQLCVNQRQPG